MFNRQRRSARCCREGCVEAARRAAGGSLGERARDGQLGLLDHRDGLPGANHVDEDAGRGPVEAEAHDVVDAGDGRGDLARAVERVAHVSGDDLASQRGPRTGCLHEDLHRLAIAPVAVQRGDGVDEAEVRQLDLGDGAVGLRLRIEHELRLAFDLEEAASALVAEHSALEQTRHVGRQTQRGVRFVGRRLAGVLPFSFAPWRPPSFFP